MDYKVKEALVKNYKRLMVIIAVLTVIVLIGTMFAGCKKQREPARDYEILHCCTRLSGSAICMRVKESR